MSAENKKSVGWTIVLLLLGITALMAGVRWLTLVIPAAVFVWYAAGPVLRSGRN